MSRYIDAELIEIPIMESKTDETWMKVAIDAVPTADVRENVHGEWIVDGHHMRCNKCNEYMCNTDREGDPIPKNFCPNCGADMRKKLK